MSPSILPTWPVERVREMPESHSEGRKGLTEGDAGVLLANLVTVVVGEEHVGRQATLGSVGV